MRKHLDAAYRGARLSRPGAADGLEALAYLSSAALRKLVLLDRSLPGMDGLEVLGVTEATLARRAAGDHRDRRGRKRRVVEALELGANDYWQAGGPAGGECRSNPDAAGQAQAETGAGRKRRALRARDSRGQRRHLRLAYDRGEGHFSPRWRALLGCDASSPPTLDTWYSRVHPDDIAPLHASIAEHLDGRTEHFEFEHRVQGPNDSYRWVLARGLAVRNADGKPIRLTGSISDITEGKVADALTGLPNRTLLMDRLGRLLGYTRRNRGSRWW